MGPTINAIAEFGNWQSFGLEWECTRDGNCGMLREENIISEGDKGRKDKGKKKK